MSDTPRTDAETFAPLFHGDTGFDEPEKTLVKASFARQLERELTAAKKSIAHSAEANKAWLAEFDNLKSRVEKAEDAAFVLRGRLAQWMIMAEELAACASSLEPWGQKDDETLTRFRELKETAP